MSIRENAYGYRKRYDFVAEQIARFKPRQVLDIGCGTGENLTIPLATAFPDSRFVAVDSDSASIDYAQNINTLANLTFAQELAPEESFDLVIASEVIEHVDHPAQFLIDLRGRLSDQGKLILTLPNGYGPFEIATFTEVIVQLSGIRKQVQRLKRRLGRGQAVTADSPGTLAVSPHINFFSFGHIKKMIRGTGFTVEQFRPRTFLCGYCLDGLICRLGLFEWNARAADKLPAMMVSDWMFVLTKGPTPPTVPVYKRNFYAKMRRYLNKKFWNIP